MKIRQLIFLFLLLCATAVRAQFHSVDWGAERGDSLLPVCTHIVDLSADYAAYNYSARIEYPEWVQPIGSHDSYERGDKVTHNHKKWVSETDGNVWQPGVYGWAVVE